MPRQRSAGASAPPSRSYDPVPYRDAGNAARRAAADLYAAWEAAAGDDEDDPIGKRRRRLLGRPLNSTAAENRELSAPRGLMSERLLTAINVRLILMADELDVSPTDPDWATVVRDRLLARTLRGGAGWFLRRNPVGRRSAFPPEILREAERLLGAIPTEAPYGAKAAALRSLLEREGLPLENLSDTIRKLMEAVRQARRSRR